MILKAINKIIKTLNLGRNVNNDIYNTEIYKNGLKGLLIEYKGMLEGSNDIDNNKRKIKELEFHLNILNKSINKSV